MQNEIPEIPSQFDNRYLTELSIKDHLHELISIHTAFVQAKNADHESDTQALDLHYQKELADLFLLLNHYRKITGGEFDRILLERGKKFQAKSAKDETGASRQ